MFPDFNGWLETQWGSGDEGACFLAQFSGASNIVVGTNPPYCVGDFVSFYPKFAGGAKPNPLPGAVLTMGSAVVAVTTALGGDARRVIDGRALPWPDARFADAAHLLYPNHRDFTAHLARSLAERRLAGGSAE